MNTNNKYTLLILGVIFDAIGMLSFAIPGVGEFTDVIWAPLASFLIYKMYKGTEGKIGGLITFVDEILPGLDVIPTFTLMWIYRFLIKKQK
ncbi:MAG TPA: hypothetical protein EYG92_09040 [Lutibacter sp.]|nr:hypothetical protein [Lutibacter sp.]